MRILVASVEGFLGGDVAAILAGAGLSVDRAGQADDALHMVRHFHYEALVVASGRDGEAAAGFVHRLRQGGCRLPAVAVVGAIDGRSRARVLDAGADDLLAMPCDTGELCARLRAVVRRARGFARSVLMAGALELHMDRRVAVTAGRELHLSPSEYRVLELLMLRKGTLVSKTALMDLLYGAPEEPDMRALNVLMHRLRKRLAAEGLGTLVRTIWGTGYMLSAAPQPFVAIPAPGRRDMELAAD